MDSTSGSPWTSSRSWRAFLSSGPGPTWESFCACHNGDPAPTARSREHYRRTPTRRLPKPHCWSLVVASLLLTACSTVGSFRVPASGPGNYPPLVFTHRVATPDVEVYWNCTHPEQGTLDMDGLVHNFGGREVRFVELNLVGVGPRGNTVSETTTSLPDIVLHLNQTSPFDLRLRTAGSETRFDLYYQYRLGFGSGFPAFPDETHRFYARDVYSEAQHRVR